jgi:uncharacterized circularly permuted ATP-grasp superfamily protein
MNKYQPPYSYILFSYLQRLKTVKVVQKLFICLTIFASSFSFATPNPFVRQDSILYDNNGASYRVVQLLSPQKAQVQYLSGKIVGSILQEMSLEDAVCDCTPDLNGNSVGQVIAEPVGKDYKFFKVLAMSPGGKMMTAPWNGTEIGGQFRWLSGNYPSIDIQTYKDISLDDIIFDKNGIAWQVKALNKLGLAYVIGWDGIKSNQSEQKFLLIEDNIPRASGAPIFGIAVNDIVFDQNKVPHQVLGISPSGKIAVSEWNGTSWSGVRKMMDVYTLPYRPKEKPQAPLDIDMRIDEVARAQGSVKDQYEALLGVYTSIPATQRQTLYQQFLADYQGDNSMLPVPRLIPSQEYESVLKPGIEQRGRALLLLAQDWYSGEASFLKKGIVPENVFYGALTRQGESGFHVRPESITFPYGPDLAKDNNGQWRVIEDSIGMLGGMGDLLISQEALLNRIPEYKQILKIENSTQFYQSMVDKFKEIAKTHNGELVAYLVGSKGDHESERLKLILEKLGVMVLFPIDKARLKVSENKLYVDQKPVGFLYLNMEHDYLNGTNKVAQTKSLMRILKQFVQEDKNPKLASLRNEANDFLNDIDIKSGLPRNQEKFFQWAQNSGFDQIVRNRYSFDHIPGLTELLEKGSLATNYSPGVDFLNDKGLYAYVEDLIRFYLKQEPILKSIETRSITIKGDDYKIDEEFMKSALNNQDKWVIKEVDNRGGKGVIVGRRVSQEEFKRGLEQARKNPIDFRLQEYISLSMIIDHILDVRIHSSISAIGDPLVSRFPWGRGIDRNRNGKVNLSDTGIQVPTFIIEDVPNKLSQRSCSEVLN